MREFYSDDETFGSGLAGILEWFESEGADLLGTSATLENTDSFIIRELEAGDIAHLPLQDQRDLTQAKGVVAVMEMPCSWQSLEPYLVRGDQAVVFDDTWDAYTRTYRSERTAYDEARSSADFPAIDAALRPFDDDFDPAPYQGSLLLTDNLSDPVAVLFVDFPTYPLHVSLRHGRFDRDGDALEGMVLSSFSSEATWDEGGSSGLLQSYSVEIHLAVSAETTLRMLALWNETVSPGLEPDAPLVLSQTINKALTGSERLSSLCTGESALPEE